MTYEEFKRHVGKAGLTISSFAALLKLKPTSITNHAKADDVPSHLAVIAVLLAELAEQKVDYRSVLAKVEIAPKKARGAGIGKFGGDPQSSLFAESSSNPPAGETK